MAARSAPVATSPDAASSRQPIQLPRVVFLQMPGPSGGGGGGGTRQAAPPSRSQANGRDRLNVPLATPVAASQQSPEAPCPPQELLLDAVPLASGAALLAGLPDARPSLDISKGPGLGGGIGEGTGTGIGAGTGAGLGPGLSRGFGDGAYRPGGGVVPPTLLKQVRPNYTTEALRLRIQGSVMLEVVVGRDGIPLAIRITRSLESRRARRGSGRGRSGVAIYTRPCRRHNSRRPCDNPVGLSRPVTTVHWPVVWPSVSWRAR